MSTRSTDNDTANYGLQEHIRKLVGDNPEWRNCLQEMVDYEDLHQNESSSLGWEWQEVHTTLAMVNRMIAAGIVNMEYKSRSSRSFKLKSLEDTRQALTLQFLYTDSEEEEIDVESLFEVVEGHDNIKQILRFSLNADKPVHCLLYGPVATAKSLLVADIAKLPGAHMYLGSTTTKSGLVGMLLNYKPQYLIIDEIDKMSSEDRQPLLSLMASGVVTKLHSGANENVSLTTKVFACANDLSKVDGPILSRFVKIEVPSYNRETFIKVVQRVLVMQEGLGKDSSLMIANVVSRHTLDARQAVFVARMSKGFPQRILEIEKILWPEEKIERMRGK